MEWGTRLKKWTEACTSCRLCMDNPGTVNMFTPLDWSIDILTHTGIKVTPKYQDFHGEKLYMPQFMCETCHDTVQNAKILKAGALKTDQKWQHKRQELQLPPENYEKELETTTPSLTMPQYRCTALSKLKLKVFKQQETLDMETETPSSTVNETAQSTADKSNKHNKRKARSSSSHHQDRKKAPKPISVRKDLIDCPVKAPKPISVRKDLIDCPVKAPKPISVRKDLIDCPVKAPISVRKDLIDSPVKAPNPISVRKDLIDCPVKAPNPISVRKDLIDCPVKSDKKKKCHNGTSRTKSSRESNESTLTTPQVLQILTGEDTVSSNVISPSELSTAKRKLIMNTQDLECDICQKTYETRKKLYIHKLTHNKKYYCPLDLCGKRFAIKGDLQKHIRSHTGEKPFKCHLCEQSFSQRGTLKVHDENVHREKHT